MTGFGKEINRRSVLKGLAASGVAAFGGGLPLPALSQTRKLVIISNEATQGARDVFSDVVRRFGEDTKIDVALSFMDYEGHKTAIRNYLVTSPPDVNFWNSGERMRTFVKLNLFDDISDLVEKEGYKNLLGGTISSVTVHDKQWGLPLGGRLYGNFYLENVLADAGLKPPQTWDDLLAFVKAAKQQKLVPIAMGTKQIWPAAGFFDTLNLRINGLEFHMALMNGQVSYQDTKLKTVFDHWQQLLEIEAFFPDHTSYTFADAAALLGRGEAAFMNIGGYIDAQIPEAKRGQLNLFAFPKIADIPRYEDFTVDSIHIPARAANKSEAREFLRYFYRAENIGPYTTVKNYLPARNDLDVSKNRLIALQSEQLKTVAGTAQYFDRDTDPTLAQEAMKGFQEFMVLPGNRDAILARLEQVRARVYK